MEFGNVVIAIFLAGFGIFRLVDPEEAIYLESFWKYRSSEPEERYIRITRISGGICIACAILVLIFTFAG